MIVKLIENPWVSDTLPEGLTLGNTYKCIEIFNSNPYDEYFRIINGNEAEDAWNSSCFEVIEGENKEKHNSMLEEMKKIDELFETMNKDEIYDTFVGNGYSKEEYREESHKTWFKSLSETKEEIRRMAENIDYCEKEVLLTAAFHYLEEYEQLLLNK
ncbi:hypothetical protein [Clostridium perfringens]|uniref:hypothetical protein n=1 Tax=Clostridium perfringens TaxID=1502 RepID=UPI0037488161